MTKILADTVGLSTAETQAIHDTQNAFHLEARLVLAEIAFARGDPDAKDIGKEALARTEAGGQISIPVYQRVRDRVERADG